MSEAIHQGPARKGVPNPLFITLEGIEGCGKSLQAGLLSEELERLGIPFIATREPGGTPFGLEVRQILLSRDGAPRKPLSELLLYLADRYQDFQERIEPALLSGRHVICDRYHDATMAYQGFARGIGFETIDRLAKILQLRSPDLTLVLDIDIETGVQRARQRQTGTQEDLLSRFEREELEFHHKVLEGYRLLAKREPGRLRFVDASGTPQEVFARIRSIACGIGLLPSSREGFRQSRKA
ncbi:MAG: dTMP kinase [Acidobacteriota bacterium]